MENKIKYIECDCWAPEHVIRFMFDEEYKCVYIELHLQRHNSFFKRLKITFNYLFKLDSNYVSYSGSIIEKKKIKELRDDFTKFLRKIK